jgi:hypothetical protein
VMRQCLTAENDRVQARLCFGVSLVSIGESV